MRTIYTAHPDYTGRLTLPVLRDHERSTIVNSESAQVMRMLDRAFAAFSDGDLEHRQRRGP